MIEPKEINKVAASGRVSDRQIEKDYVISWVLFAISKNKILSSALVFQGGTVLKKAYINNYRFSEDLDFTLMNESLTNVQIMTEFKNLFNFIKEESNIEMQIDQNKDATSDTGNLQFYIDYIGPLKGSMGSRDLKVDVTRKEILETKVEYKSIFRNYSDLEEDFKLNCYSLAEVLIEKMCTIMGRTQPRDLYDIWYLLEVQGLEIDQYWLEYKQKAKNKNYKPEDFPEKFVSKLQTFKQRWEKTLGAQIHNLPEFEKIERSIKKHIKKFKSRT